MGESLDRVLCLSVETDGALDRVLLAQVPVRGYQRQERGRQQSVRPHTQTKPDFGFGSQHAGYGPPHAGFAPPKFGFKPQEKGQQGRPDWAINGDAAQDAAARKTGPLGGQPWPDAAHIAEHLASAHGVTPGGWADMMAQHEYLHSSGIGNNHTHEVDVDANDNRDKVQDFEAEANSMGSQAAVQRMVSSNPAAMKRHVLGMSADGLAKVLRLAGLG